MEMRVVMWKKKRKGKIANLEKRELRVGNKQVARWARLGKFLFIYFYFEPFYIFYCNIIFL